MPGRLVGRQIGQCEQRIMCYDKWALTVAAFSMSQNLLISADSRPTFFLCRQTEILSIRLSADEPRRVWHSEQFYWHYNISVSHFRVLSHKYQTWQCNTMVELITQTQWGSLNIRSGKFIMFDRFRRLSLKRYEINSYSYYGSLTLSHMYPIDPYQFR